jgi:hypothetical protein
MEKYVNIINVFYYIMIYIIKKFKIIICTWGNKFKHV